MSYDKNTWKDNDYITTSDMNRIENGLKYVANKAGSSYVKTFWKNGDIVTADKLNNIENGIEKITKLVDSDFNLQTKTITYTPTENQITDIITKDIDYDFLDEVNVNVNAIPNNYVGSSIPRRNSNNITVIQNPLSVSVPSGYYESSISKELDLEPSLVRFIDYDGEILHEYSKDEFLALSSMPANPDTSRFKPIVGAIITDPGEDFFNGITNDEGKISFNVFEIESWRDYPNLVVDGLVFNDSTLNSFLDAMLDAVNFNYNATVTITKNNKQYKLIVDWPAGSDVNKTGTLQIFKLQDSLVPQGWNWSLSDAKDYVQEWGYLNIGQMYITQSGDTEIDVEFPEDSLRLSPYLGIAIYGVVDIDWGDNSTHSTVTGDSLTSQIRTQHTYSQPGNYTIKIHVISGSFSFYSSGNSPLLNVNKFSEYIYNVVYSSKVKNIRIGDNCVINTRAFEYCYSLNSITIPNTVTSIGTYAFQNCRSLQSITIPNTVTSISDYAFSNCSSFKSITIPNSVTSIGSYVFQYCYSLQSITIPNSVTSIGTSIFSNCYSLNTRIIPKTNLKYVQNLLNVDYCINNCYNIKNVIIPEGVTSIDKDAFQYCYSLQSVTIPSSVTSIDKDAFQYCYSLQSITIPSGVISINSNAFRECYSLNSITIPDTVTSIGTYIFRDCRSLQSITIPNTVTSISDYAFQNCYSLQSITIPNTITSIGDTSFRDCHSLQSVTIPSSVISIKDNAFYNCHSLQSITIPSGVISINSNTFYKCVNMKEIHLKSTTPPSLSSTNAFYGVPSDCIFYVPQGALSSYQSAANWSTYADKMQEESN